MKKIKDCFFILTLASVFVLNQAFTNPVEHADESRLDTLVTTISIKKTIERIESNLINNHWKQNQFEADFDVAYVAFDFSDLGTLTITTQYANTSMADVDNVIWRIDSQDGQPVLILTNTATDESTIYSIEETPEGFTLKHNELNKGLSLSVSK